jgi:L-lactate dehydrogenase complex protein LldE
VPDVQLFVTCLVDAFAPEAGRATVALLERAGCIVFFPSDQTCCGQPAHNAGLSGRARSMAAATVATLDATTGPIVTPSGSCADMLIHHTPRLLEGTVHHAAATRVAGRVRELTQFLVDDLDEAEVGPAPCDGCAVAYHPSCHGLRNLGIARQPAALLGSVEGIRTVVPEDAEQCCGFGGLFALEMPEVSAAILAGKLDAFEASGADVIVGGDISCLMHIEGGLRRRNSSIRVQHIAEFLAGGSEHPGT